MSQIRFVESAPEAPAAPGAYALWLRLTEPLAARVAKNRAVLSPGDYLYCGSANGPGGLRARLARHMRREKRAHWHVDQLTRLADIRGAFVLEGGDECALNEALRALPIPFPGFGGSDCPRCASHLRFLPATARLPSAWENARKAAETTAAVKVPLIFEKGKRVECGG
jgi:histidyl-tRNA synthetase